MIEPPCWLYGFELTVFNLKTDLLPNVGASEADGLERQLRDFISSRELPLYRIMSYQLGWVDENGDPALVPTQPRIRGQLALSVANALGAGTAKATPYATSVELLYNFTLIHEDVEDGNTERNDRPSVWWTWGPAQAINAGDGMHAMARLALFTLTDRGEEPETVAQAVHALDTATVAVCEGEYLDITMQEQFALSTERYLHMVSARAGAMFGCSAQLAAIASGAERHGEALFKFGQLAGAARQVALDHALFWGDERPDPIQHGRFLSKKKNLPVIHAMETASPTVKRKLGDFYVQRVIDPQRLGEIKELVEEAGARERCEETVRDLLSQAGDIVDSLELDATANDSLKSAAAALAGL